MRARINKAVSEDDIIVAADRVGAAAMRRLKLYFMIGLPDEEEEDVQAMADLGVAIKARLDAAGHGTELVMSVGPLVPKPATAYQELAQSEARLVRERQQILKRAFKSTGIRLRGDSTTWARIDDICSRSDQRLAHAILEMNDPSSGEWLRAAAKWGLDGPQPWGGGPSPWSAVETGISARFFARELDKHGRAKSTIPCPPPEIGCNMCGVCGGNDIPSYTSHTPGSEIEIVPLDAIGAPAFPATGV